MSLEKSNERINREKRTDQLLGSSLNELKNNVKLEEHNMDEMIMTLNESFDDYKEKYEKSKDFVIPEITPIGQSIITSATLLNILEQKKYLAAQKFDINMMDTLKKSVSDVQVVVAVGPSCQQVKIGDLVKIRFEDFTRVVNPNTVNSQEVFELPLEEIDGNQYIEMHERNLKYIYNK